MANNQSDLGIEFKYLIVNEMDRRFGLWVNTVGLQAIFPNSPYPFKDHSSGYFFNADKGRVLREYQLVYITKGCGLFSSDSTLSYSWFRNVFKDYTGYAPAKYFQELKLLKAKQLLVSTSQSVKEISFLLGCQSTEHFFSFFKKYTGLTPLEYRSFGREE
ncbi:MAG: AraC family transcriptional regulator [Bacteroides sp.]|uniref:helix-turn-helix domain-containing protein n=1 Tax=Bacteroides sp. TaxID=29523 RepID=UPI002FCAD40E